MKKIYLFIQGVLISIAANFIFNQNNIKHKIHNNEPRTQANENNNKPVNDNGGINTNYNNSNIGNNIENVIDRQKKVDEAKLDKVRVVVNNDNSDMDSNSRLSYGYTITYDDFHKGQDNKVTQYVDGNKKFGNRLLSSGQNSSIYNLGQEDSGADEGGSGEYVSLSELFNIKIQINGGYQPNTKVTLDSKYKQLIEYQAYTSPQSSSSIYYSIEAKGILTCPQISLIEHWTDKATGKEQNAEIGRYGVYNFYSVNGGWAIALSSILAPAALMWTFGAMFGFYASLRFYWSDAAADYRFANLANPGTMRGAGARLRGAWNILLPRRFANDNVLERMRVQNNVDPPNNEGENVNNINNRQNDNNNNEAMSTVRKPGIIAGGELNFSNDEELITGLKIINQSSIRLVDRINEFRQNMLNVATLEENIQEGDVDDNALIQELQNININRRNNEEIELLKNRLRTRKNKYEDIFNHASDSYFNFTEEAEILLEEIGNYILNQRYDNYINGNQYEGDEYINLNIVRDRINFIIYELNNNEDYIEVLTDTWSRFQNYRNGIKNVSRDKAQFASLLKSKSGGDDDIKLFNYVKNIRLRHGDELFNNYKQSVEKHLDDTTQWEIDHEEAIKRSQFYKDLCFFSGGNQKINEILLKKSRSILSDSNDIKIKNNDKGKNIKDNIDGIINNYIRVTEGFLTSGLEAMNPNVGRSIEIDGAGDDVLDDHIGIALKYIKTDITKTENLKNQFNQLKTQCQPKTRDIVLEEHNVDINTSEAEEINVLTGNFENYKGSFRRYLRDIQKSSEEYKNSYDEIKALYQRADSFYNDNKEAIMNDEDANKIYNDLIQRLNESLVAHEQIYTDLNYAKKQLENNAEILKSISVSENEINFDDIKNLKNRILERKTLLEKYINNIENSNDETLIKEVKINQEIKVVKTAQENEKDDKAIPKTLLLENMKKQKELLDGELIKVNELIKSHWDFLQGLKDQWSVVNDYDVAEFKGKLKLIELNNNQ